MPVAAAVSCWRGLLVNAGSAGVSSWHRTAAAAGVADVDAAALLTSCHDGLHHVTVHAAEP